MRQRKRMSVSFVDATLLNVILGVTRFLSDDKLVQITIGFIGQRQILASDVSDFLDFFLQDLLQQLRWIDDGVGLLLLIDEVDLNGILVDFSLIERFIVLKKFDDAVNHVTERLVGRRRCGSFARGLLSETKTVVGRGARVSRSYLSVGLHGNTNSVSLFLSSVTVP